MEIYDPHFLNKVFVSEIYNMYEQTTIFDISYFTGVIFNPTVHFTVLSIERK